MSTIAPWQDSAIEPTTGTSPVAQPSPFDLNGRVAVVTGGNGGIGLGMAKGLISAGAQVMVAGRNNAKGSEAVAILGPRSSFATVDVMQAESCRALVTKTVERYGRLDILINSAGITNRRRPEEHTDEQWQAVIGTNLSSAFFTAHAAYPHLKASGHGRVINVGSLTSVFGAPFAAAYAASKGGLLLLTKALATAWAEDGILVNAVLPGWIDTDMGAEAKTEVAGLNDRVLARTPAGRWGRADDFEGIAVFLASDASGFITGTGIPVDGGYSANG